MTYRKINDKRRDHHRSRSLSPADYERHSKRRKHNGSSFSSFKASSNDFGHGTDWKFRNMEIELATLRNKLSLSEDAVTKYHKLKKRSEEFYVKERNTLKRRAQMYRETLQRLKRDLETSRKTAHEARRAKAATEAEILRVKTKMEQRVTELLEANAKSREEFKLQRIELQKARITIDQLMSEKRSCETKKRVDENWQRKNDGLQRTLDVEHRTPALATQKKITKPAQMLNKYSLGGNNNKIPLAKTSNGKVSSKSPSDSKKALAKILNKDNSSSSAFSDRPKLGSSSHPSSLARYDDDSSTDASESSSDFSSDSSSEFSSDSSPDFPSDSSSNPSSSPSSQASDYNFGDSKKAEERRSRRLRIGTYRYVLVSSRDFFGIDWGKEYSREESEKWVCKTCARSLRSRKSIEDHVWSKHYAGAFECPHCIISATRYAARYKMMEHIRRNHPNQYQRPRKW